jgi:outer membrane protein assembly factor BamD (BamD/ComL family)
MYCLQVLCQKTILKALFLEKPQKKAKEVKAKMPDFLKKHPNSKYKPKFGEKAGG